MPSLRKPLGMILILLIILAWCLLFASQIDRIAALNFWLQIPIYVVAGIIWIFPIRPLLRWMEPKK